jgi:hypothetical protein
MPSLRHLQRKREEVQEQYELLSEKISRLRADSAIQAGTSVSFQLDKEILRLEVVRDRLVTQLEQTERLFESERLHIELSRLNYVAQVRLFREFLEERRVGAFLVHGEQQHGQIFLVRRFLQAIPDSSVTPPIQVHLSRRAMRTDIDALWRELGRQIGVRDFSSQQDISRQAIAQLQSQHIVLVFHDIDCVSEDFLKKLIQDFWLPLANLAQRSLKRDNEFFLLMFLLDQEGCASSWSLEFAEQFDTAWEPGIPVRLPVIDRLSEQVLLHWLENAIDTLPIQVTKKIEHTVKVILEESEGVPERVFAQIFSLCNCSWQEGEDRWLKL